MTLDPSVFLPSAVDAETAAYNAELEAFLATMPSPHTLPPAVVRAARRAPQEGPPNKFRPPLVFSDNASVRTIDGPAGPITLRCFIPPQVDGVYYHIHGGGWVLGSADSQDLRLDAIANACNLAVVSVEYRLAPEDPYPAGPDDCEAAAVWLAKNARAEFGMDRLLIGGESAGAHLSVVTLLRLRDKHGLMPFSAANLAYGVYDLDGTPSVHNWGQRYLILSQPIMQWFGDQYAAPEIRKDPDVSPMYAGLHNMPKARFSVGTMDPLMDDTLFLHARWVAAGNEASLEVFPGGIHGFPGNPTAMGARARKSEEDFLRDAGKVTAAK
jgi:acetyl esterase/lipase